MSIMDKKLRVTMPDGSRYDVPVAVIARNRAKFYAYIFGGDEERSFVKDTLPLFESDYEIKNWAASNMNWSDVKDVAVEAPREPREVDYQDGWVNGRKEVVS